MNLISTRGILIFNCVFLHSNSANGCPRAEREYIVSLDTNASGEAGVTNSSVTLISVVPSIAAAAHRIASRWRRQIILDLFTQIAYPVI